MPFKVTINPSQPDTQAAIIPDATERTVGVISLSQVRAVAGGIALQRVVQEEAAFGANEFDIAAGDLMVINGGGETASVTVNLPSAATVAMVAVKNYATLTGLSVAPSGDDTVELDTTPFSPVLLNSASQVFVSDGVSNWVLLSLYGIGG